MAKKNKRITSGRATSVSMASSSPAKGAEFNPDYTYVKKDLSRIGMLAGFFFVVLIVLSFFLR